MLEYLSIENLAVISSTEMEFGPGLNIISGETGAGKSMVVQALSILRGERAFSNWIRSGEASARIQAVFDTEGAPVPDFLTFPEAEDHTSFTIERVVREGGKGRIKVNGSLLTAAQLKELTGLLIELSSQHDQQLLLMPSHYLTLVDDAGDLALMRHEYQAALGELDTLAQAYDLLKQKGDAREREIDSLTFRQKELLALSPHPGELEELRQQRLRLKAGHQILAMASKVDSLLYSDDAAVLEILHGLSREMGTLAPIEPRFEEGAAMVNEAITLLDEVTSIMRDLSNVEDELSSLEAVEARLHRLERGLAKYAVESEEALLALLDATKNELDAIENYDHSLKKALAQVETAREKAGSLALALHGAREKTARQLALDTTQELTELGFPNARFFIIVEPLAPRADTPWHRVHGEHGLARSGITRVDFLFNANPGEASRPVSQGASGGELSRIHLAIKVALAHGDKVVTTVYDEIDSGIGGPVAQSVGEKLRRVGKHRQVICITHLPQIAAFGDSHFSVFKEVRDERTYTGIKELTGEERIEELARMLGGISPESLDHARALLNRATADPLTK
ncbi:DNA repair protein RecN [Myxococcota bacterium]|nr:DNA repair protein RecN [Myxococcota bacterium]